MIRMVLPAFGLFAVLSFPCDLAAQSDDGDNEDCGNCVESTLGGDPVHQMTDLFWESHVCESNEGNGGHYVHDCANGDENTWTYGDCDTHDACPGSGVLNLRHFDRLQSIDERVAMDLSRMYPDGVSFETGSSWMFLRSCKGAVVAAVRVTVAE